MKLFTAIVGLLLGQICLLNAYKIDIETPAFEYGKPIESMTLDVSQGDPKNPILNFRAEVTEDIMDPLILHIRMYQLENGVYESMQVNVSIGLCQFLAKTKKYPMVKFVISELSKTNNIPTQCPIKKGIYSIKNLAPNMGLLDIMPPFIPEGSFKHELTLNRAVDGNEQLLLKLVTSVRIQNAGGVGGLRLLKLLN